MRGFQERYGEHVVRKNDVLAVTLAGLLHDVGHPAFSHTFEEFMRKRQESAGEKVKWSHEDASQLLIKQLWKDVGDEALREAGLNVEDSVDVAIEGAEATERLPRDLRFIMESTEPPKEKIEDAMRNRSLKKLWADPKGVGLMGRPFEKAWMYEIISSRRGFDLDRLDYFMRDPQSFGLVSGISSEIPRLLKSMRIKL